MEAASSKIVLERLKEVWVEVADASVYRELELEKQLWMLTALRSLKKKSSSEEIVVCTGSRPAKVLSLYENHGMSSNLSSHQIMLTIIQHPARPSQHSQPQLRSTISQQTHSLQNPTQISIPSMSQAQLPNFHTPPAYLPRFMPSQSHPSSQHHQSH